MRIRNLVIAVALAAATAAPGMAQVSASKAEWAKGPVQFLMTDEEKAMWQKLPSDDAALAFIDLFWARRDPTPNTPQNEFREAFEAKVKAADENLKGSRQRGALTDRGKILILFGPPTRIKKEGGTAQQRQGGGFEDSTQPSSGPTGFHENQNLKHTWIYDGDAAQKIFGSSHVEIAFVDQWGNGDFRLTSGREIAAVEKKAIAAAVTQPTLTKVPVYGAQQPAAAAAAAPQTAPAAAPAPAAPADALKTPALRDAISAAKGTGSTLKKGSVAYAEFVSPSGEFYVPLGITVAKGSGATAEAYDTIFGQVEDAGGTVVSAFEETTKPTVFKGGLFADHTVVLPSGKYTAVIGLAKAGAPVVIGSKTIEIKEVPKDGAGTSKLIVTNDLVELTDPAPEKAGFAFGKTKVIPTAEFEKTDNLIFFVEIHNPGIDPATNAPKLQASLDFSGGKFKKPISRPLTEQPVAPLSGKPGPGEYAVIDSIPLDKIQNLAPGDYTLKMKVVDTVTKQSYTVEQAFKITG